MSINVKNSEEARVLVERMVADFEHPVSPSQTLDKSGQSVAAGSPQAASHSRFTPQEAAELRATVDDIYKSLPAVERAHFMLGMQDFCKRRAEYTPYNIEKGVWLSLAEQVASRYDERADGVDGVKTSADARGVFWGMLKRALDNQEVVPGPQGSALTPAETARIQGLITKLLAAIGTPADQRAFLRDAYDVVEAAGRYQGKSTKVAMDVIATSMQQAFPLGERSAVGVKTNKR